MREETLQIQKEPESIHQEFTLGQSENEYDNCNYRLTVEETEEITRFAKENNLTLNTIIQGALGIILQNYNHIDEVVLGTTVSGRSINLEKAEEIVGLFINTLPLRIKRIKNESIESFLKRLQEEVFI